MFLKNKNIIFRIRRSKVTDYADLIKCNLIVFIPSCGRQICRSIDILQMQTKCIYQIVKKKRNNLRTPIMTEIARALGLRYNH